MPGNPICQMTSRAKKERRAYSSSQPAVASGQCMAWRLRVFFPARPASASDSVNDRWETGVASTLISPPPAGPFLETRIRTSVFSSLCIHARKEPREESGAPQGAPLSPALFMCVCRAHARALAGARARLRAPPRCAGKGVCSRCSSGPFLGLKCLSRDGPSLPPSLVAVRGRWR